MVLTVRHNRNVAYNFSFTPSELREVQRCLNLYVEFERHKNDEGGFLSRQGTILVKIQSTPKRVRLRIRKFDEMTQYVSYYSLDLSFTKEDFEFFVRWMDVPNNLSSKPHGKYDYDWKWTDDFKGSGINITKQFGGREKVLTISASPSYKNYKQYINSHSHEYGHKTFINRNFHDLLYPKK